jgi:zinc protease
LYTLFYEMRQPLSFFRPVKAALLIALTAISSTAHAQNCEIRNYPHAEKTLENGLHIVTVQTPFPNVVSLQVTIHRRRAAAESSSLPYLVERMLRRGTAAHSAAQYEEILRTANARQSAETSDDRTTFRTVFTRGDLENVLQLEADRFQNLKFTEADVRDEAGAVQTEYRRTSESPVFRLFETQRQKAFAAHPYQYGKFGSRKDINTLATQYSAAKTFFERWYKPEHTTVTLVGDIDPPAATQLVERFFGSWTRGNGTTPEPAPEPEPTSRVVEQVWWKSETPAWVTVAVHGPAYDDSSPDFAALELLLEAYFGAGSELYRRLVIDEEKVDLFGIDFPAAADPHLATVYARLKHPKDLVYVRDLIVATIAAARNETLTADRLAAVKANLHQALLTEMESAEGTATMLAPRLQLSDPMASASNYACKRAALTAGDVHDAARKYFTDSRLVVVTLSHALRQLPLPELPPLDATVRETPAAASSTTTEFPIVVQKTASPLLETKLVFNAGSGRDPAGKEGLAYLTAAMIAQGHPVSRNAEQTRDALYASGGSISPSVEKETTTFTLRAPRSAWRELLDAALPMILEPALDRADFLTLRSRQQQAFDRFVVDEMTFSRELLQRRAYFASPYDHPPLGSDDGIASATLRDIRGFISAHYRTGNLTVGVSGDVPSEFEATLRQRLASLPSGVSSSEPIKYSGAGGLNIDIFEDPGAERATFSVGFPLTVTRAHKDFAALAVAAMVFGDPQSDSRLYDRLIRTRELASIAAAHIEQTPSVQQRINDPLVVRRSSLFEVNVGAADSKNTTMALRIVLFELKKLIKDGITASEFTRARDILVKEIALAEGNSSRWLGDELDARWYGGTRWSDIRETLSRLTVADVNAAIKQHLQATNALVAIVTKDAREQRLDLRKPTPSAISYRETKPKKLLDEDAVIAAMPLDLESEDVRFYTMEDLQEQGW